MKSVESTVFNINISYNKDVAQKLIIAMKNAPSERRRSSIRHFLFKMMKEVVKKNVQNYQNLLRGIDGLRREDIPVIDDLIGDCWEVFYVCAKKYDPEKGDNFYFFYNKALSRKFYRDYQDRFKSVLREQRLDDRSDIENRMLSGSGGAESVELIIDTIGFKDVEKRIIYSKLKQQSTKEFLDENRDITIAIYSRAWSSIKEKISKEYRK